jgi:modulator of FtsH protease HflC
MRRLVLAVFGLLALAGGLVAAGNLGIGPLVITREDEQKIILFLSQATRVTQPGLSLRWPLLESAETYDRRWLYLNTDPDTVQTKDGEQLMVDNYAIWRIQEAIEFKRSFPRGMAEAEQRIDRAVRDDVREVIGRHTLEEVLKDMRADIMQEITEKTRSTLSQFGIRVADVRINRTELPSGTEASVYARMVTERERLAKKSRAEGEERARRIRAEADREAKVIVAEAKRDADIARGEGEAKATQIYAEAYGRDPEFYAFQRSLEAYRKALREHTTLVVSPDSDFFRYLMGRGALRGGGGGPSQ